MKWALILWAVSGPTIHGVFESERVCNALAQHVEVRELAPVRFCAAVDVDALITDVVIYAEPTPPMRQTCRLVDNSL